MEMIFKRCNKCGQIIGIINETGVPIICCGEEMETISPCTLEKELGEKHIPTYTKKDNKVIVKVGSLPHPSTSAHYISWIALSTNKGNQRKILAPGDAPTVTFYLDKDEEVLQIYAYCNIHSLWLNDVSACTNKEHKEDECK